MPSRCLLLFALLLVPLRALSQAPPVAQEQPADTTPGDEADPLGSPKVGEASFRPGAGILLASEDNRFALLVGLRAQMLYTLQHLQETPWTHALELRRGRVVLSGHTFGKHNRYRLQLHFAPREVSGGEGEVKLSALRDVVLIFDYLRDFTVQVGQYKVPFSRERVISSGKLQMGDRSIVNREFTLDRDIGLEVRSEDFLGLDLMRYYAGVFMGEGAGTFEQRDIGLLLLARFEVLPFGRFDDYSGGVQEPSEKPQLSLGVGVAHLNNARKDQGILGSTPADGGTTDTTHLALDLILKWFGWSLQAELVTRSGQRNPGHAQDPNGQPIAPQNPRDGFGAFAQSGFLIGAGVEVSGRYGTIQPLGEGSALSPSYELGTAVSWYIDKHAFKLQADYFRLWDQRGLSTGDDRLRVVLQLSL